MVDAPPAREAIGREREEVSAAVAQVLEREGIVIRADAKCLSVAPEGANGVRVHKMGSAGRGGGV